MKITTFLAAGLLLATSGVAQANWTLNIGYQNPIVSTWGLNLLYIGNQFGFEAGVGWVDADAQVANDEDEENDRASVHVAGDIDLKYFLTSGGARAFIQGGFGLGFGAAVGDGGGAGAGTGGGFAGIGLLVGSPSVYAYGSFNLSGSQDTFLQAGLGIDI